MNILLFPWFQGHHSLFSSSTHLLPSVLATSDSPLFCSEFVFQSINYIMSLSVEKPLMTSTAARVPIVLNVQQYWLITQHSSTLHLKSLDSRFSELLFVIQKFHMFFIFPALCIVSGWSHSRQQFTLCWKLPNLFLYFACLSLYITGYLLHAVGRQSLLSKYLLPDCRIRWK